MTQVADALENNSQAIDRNTQAIEQMQHGERGQVVPLQGLKQRVR